MEQQNTFDKLEAEFEAFKEKAGGISYVACFGKTFLEKESEEFKLAENVAELLVDSGFGVIHGGYCGVMEASSNGANRAIAKDKTKNSYWNIGVPMKTFDAELAHSSFVNLPSAEDIGDRKKALISFCDICVILPSGGFGTLLESLEIFHNNQIAEKFGGKIKPLIFVKGNWKKIFDGLYQQLDMNKQSGGDKFCYFIDTTEELGGILKDWGKA